MKNAVLVLVVALVAIKARAIEHDFLALEQVHYKASNPNQVLNKTIDNLKPIFEKYKVQSDPSTQITSPLRVGGTNTNPTIQVGIRKCVFFVCKDVELNAVIGVQEVKGTCARTYTMIVDMARSKGVLIDNYDRLDVGICFNSKNTDAQLTVNVNAHRAPSYRPGQIQGEVFKLLKEQIPALTNALALTLKENGGERGI